MKRYEGNASRQSGPLVRFNLLKLSRDGGTYRNGRDYFKVHWEIKLSHPHKIMLHIESPIKKKDHRLNLIKSKIIKRLLDSIFENNIENKLFIIEKGKQIDLNHIEKNKCTTVFTIELLSDPYKENVRERIYFVDNYFWIICRKCFIRICG